MLSLRAGSHRKDDILKRGVWLPQRNVLKRGKWIQNGEIREMPSGKIWVQNVISSPEVFGPVATSSGPQALLCWAGHTQWMASKAQWLVKGTRPQWPWPQGDISDISKVHMKHIREAWTPPSLGEHWMTPPGSRCFHASHKSKSQPGFGQDNHLMNSSVHFPMG